jgi:tetratricopeptide (TPR) repeat protein
MYKLKLIIALVSVTFLISYPFDFSFYHLNSGVDTVNNIAKAQEENSTSSSAPAVANASDALNEIANNLDRLGMYNDAITYYNKSLAINSTNIDALNGIANDLDNLKRYDEAMTYYDKALAINSTNIDALNGIANDLDNLKRYDEAIAYYDRVLAVDPTNTDALNGKANDVDNLKHKK